MKNRRQFCQQLGVAGALAAVGRSPTVTAASAVPTDASPTPAGIRTGADDRLAWLAWLEKLTQPVLGALARGELHRTMPVEAAHPEDRRRFSHLEAFGRLLAGIAPWLEAANLPAAEAARQQRCVELARAALVQAIDPQSPDHLNFGQGSQALVDTAFLAQGLLRAPRVLRDALAPGERRQLVTALQASRAIPTPRDNNWVLFASLVEVALLTLGETTLEDRLEGGLRRMLGWYAGDGAYGDGEAWHFDYYNSYVIQPMLVDALDALAAVDPRFGPARSAVARRAQRWAVVQERLIAPDGTYPVLGRSSAYRAGAFQGLAQAALRRALPAEWRPAGVRCALTAVLQRVLGAPGTFDADGWLRIGVAGHQPGLGENYISTGSLYLTSTALLPLGLPPEDPFWRDAAAPWTAQRIWAGEALPADHALSDARAVAIPTWARH